jgi:hypothetical protein
MKRIAVPSALMVVGISSVQAIYDGTRWRVFRMNWEADTTAGHVAEKYLP